MLHILLWHPPSLPGESSSHFVIFIYVATTFLHRWHPWDGSRRDWCNRFLTLRYRSSRGGPRLGLGTHGLHRAIRLAWDHNSFLDFDPINLCVVGNFSLITQSHAWLLDLEFDRQKRVCNPTHLHTFDLVNCSVVEGINWDGRILHLCTVESNLLPRGQLLVNRSHVDVLLLSCELHLLLVRRRGVGVNIVVVAARDSTFELFLHNFVIDSLHHIFNLIVVDAT